jgi:CBS domain-containing protein
MADTIKELAEIGDDCYLESPRNRQTEGFDAGLLRESLTVLPVRRAITLSPTSTVTDAMRAMQRDHRGCVLVTDDGTMRSKLLGIFTERDVLLRIVDRGRNPASLAIADVMTPDPDHLSVHATVAYVLNKMSVGGFRHIPVVDDEHHPACVISVRDVVTFLVDAFPREILNLPTHELHAPTREGA